MTITLTPQNFTIGAKSGLLDSRYPSGYVPLAWQLPDGHYVPAKMTPVIIHPRPDNETNAWERHRRAPDSIVWRIPIVVQGGAWPFRYTVDATSAAKGMSIGETYGSTDYGVLSWASPTIGSHTITVTVYTQEYGRNTSGLGDSLSVTFTLAVADKSDTTKFLFMDSAAGSDSNSGSYSTPLRTVEGMTALTTATQCQVFWRAGTYQPIAPVALGTTKPRVWVGYPGETVHFDQSNGNINIGAASGFWISGLRLENSYLGATNWKSVLLNTLLDRVTMFENYWYNHQPGTVGSDNCACLYGGSLGTYRKYIAMVGNTYDTLGGSTNGVGTGHVYAAEYIVYENNVLKNNSSAQYSAFWPKSSNRRLTFRNNRATENISGTALSYGQGTTAGTPEYLEFCWNLLVSTTASATVQSGPYAGDWPIDVTHWNYRNTLYGRIDTKQRVLADGSLTFATYENEAVITDSTPAVFYNASATENAVPSSYLPNTLRVPTSQINSDWTLKDAYLTSVGVARGTVGHEVY